MTKFAKMFYALTLAALLMGGCKKEEAADTTTTTDPAATTPTTPPAADPTIPPAADPAAAKTDTAAATSEDWIKVYASHEPKNEKDPVEITIQKFTVTKAQFDPANLEGGTAEIELDLASIKSDAEKRDGHLQTPDYLDVAQFGKATVKVSEVKKTGDKTYTAKAEVNAHGKAQSFPINFEVLETKDDSVRIKGEHTFNRLDFGIGKEPDGENEKVAKDVSVKLELTLKKTM